MRAIDIDNIKETYCRGQGCIQPFCYYDGISCADLERFMKLFEQNEIIEAIPVSYILHRIRDTSGAESAYLSRLIRRYREEQKSNALS